MVMLEVESKRIIRIFDIIIRELGNMEGIQFCFAPT